MRKPNNDEKPQRGRADGAALGKAANMDAGTTIALIALVIAAIELGMHINQRK